MPYTDMDREARDGAASQAANEVGIMLTNGTRLC